VVGIAVGAVAVLVVTFVSASVIFASRHAPAALSVDNGASDVQSHEPRTDAPTTPAPAAQAVPKPAAGQPAAPAVATGSGTEAATKFGWQRIGGDEFSGGLANWSLYDGPGHGGNGRRSPSAVSVQNGVLAISGDSSGTTGGMAWKSGTKYGKWETRAKMPNGSGAYHPVLILWPSQIEWPAGGEIDYAETDTNSNAVSFFLHYGASNSRLDASKSIDITQWHNYAVDWSPGRITGYIDGVQWFSTTNAGVLPPGPMHQTIQLDYFAGQGSPGPAQLLVDWVRMYS
jgi:hypothetical protein